MSGEIADRAGTDIRLRCVRLVRVLAAVALVERGLPRGVF